MRPFGPELPSKPDKNENRARQNEKLRSHMMPPAPKGLRRAYLYAPALYFHVEQSRKDRDGDYQAPNQSLVWKEHS